MALAIPCAQRSASHYRVDAESVAKVAREMIKSSLVCLAQFHTHPGQCTTHSYTDDHEAMSGRRGFLSMVAPYHGSSECAFPAASPCTRRGERAAGGYSAIPKKWRG